jgi:hypothetical protein
MVEKEPVLMHIIQSIWRARWLLGPALCWACLLSTAAAQAGGGRSKGGGAWALAYGLTLMGIALGMLFVLKSSRRRERELGETGFEGAAAATMGMVAVAGIPQIAEGMRIDEVNQMLGKPKITRKASEMYAELAAAGKLSEQDAAKVFCIYEHPAGRYELVFRDKRVVQVKTQPTPPGS